MTEQSTDETAKKVEVIEPDAYPQMISKRNVVRAVATLQSQHVALKAKTAMNAYAPMLRDAIMDYVEALEEAGGDTARIFAIAHEIRNFGETAGMVTTGKVAEVLCRYMDEMERLKKPMDQTIISLHIATIARAARAEDEDKAVGHTVAAELETLVNRRLGDAGNR